MDEEELQPINEEPTKPSNPLKRAKTTGKTVLNTTFNLAKKVVHFFASPMVPLPIKIAVISVVGIVILVVVILDATADESVKAVDDSIGTYIASENVDSEGKKYFEEKASLIKMPLKDINAMYEQFKDDNTFTDDIKQNYDYILGTKDIKDSSGNSSVNSANYDILNMVKKAVSMAEKGGIEYAKDGVGRQTASTLEELDNLTRTDCSGLIWSLFKTYLNIDVGNSSVDMKENGDNKKSENGWTAEVYAIGDGELQPGDILWRETPGHVGLYVGSYGTNNHVDHGGGNDGTTPGPNNTNYEGKGNPYTHYIRYTNPNASGAGVVDPNGNEAEGYKAGFTDSKNRSYKIYCQYLEPWKSKGYWGGNIHGKGCGPTSLAIIASGYGKNKTPEDIAKYMDEKYGYTGDSPLSGTLKDFLGISNKIITSNYESEIKKCLNSGSPVVISVVSGPDNRFTGGAHIMTLLGIKNDSEVYIGNPGAPDSNTEKCGWNTLSGIISYINYAIILSE